MNTPEPTPASVASELRLITTYFGELYTEATYRYADKGSPGGDAVMLLGPAANIEAWEHNFENVERRVADPEDPLDETALEYVEDQLDTETHPLLVMSYWEDHIREIKEQPTDLRSSVYRAADYLRNNIDWAFSTDFDGLDLMASQLGDVRRNLENTIKAGDRLTRIKVRCMYCDEAPKLAVRFTAAVDRDHWFCPNTDCGHLYDSEGVTRSKHYHLFSTGAEVWISLTDAAHSTGRSIKTLRTWVQPPIPYEPTVASRRHKGRIEVWWPDVRVKHTEAKTRKRTAA